MPTLSLHGPKLLFFYSYFVNLHFFSPFANELLAITYRFDLTPGNTE